LLLFYLLDGPDSMIRVNDFLADFEAHHAPPSNLKHQTAPHALVLGKFLSDADLRRQALFGK
jgi:hypothetical protein